MAVAEAPPEVELAGGASGSGINEDAEEDAGELLWQRLQAEERAACPAPPQAAAPPQGQRGPEPKVTTLEGKKGPPAKKSKDRVRIKDFPPLPHRNSGYWIEPLCGCGIVFALDGLFIAIVHGIAASAKDNPLMHIVVGLVWVQCFISALSVGYLLAGGSGVIRRSEAVCYPMPEEVEEKLRENASGLVELDNIYGPAGSETLGSYCVRCLVWRPPKKGMMDSHHCNTCQRCVRGFDHHCGVFGRCIVRGNLPCFSILIGMVPAGILTLILAIVASTFNAVGHHHDPGVAKAAGLGYPISLMFQV